MTNHPLTDEKALSLFSFERLMDASQPITIEDAMRVATDWQLEQCIEWLENLDSKYFLAKHISLAKMMSEAMRPIQEDN